MLDKLTREDFAKHLNQSFTLRHDAGDLALELIEAAPIETTAKLAEGRRAQFSLVFRGPKERPFGQMTYQIEHEVMGSLDLFMVPLGPDDQGMLYEVVFT